MFSYITPFKHIQTVPLTILFFFAITFTAFCSNAFYTIFWILANSLSPSSLGYFAVNIFNQNAWKKWSTSLCHLQTIQTMYVNGDITTGTMTIPNPNPQTRSTTPTITVPKSMLFGEGTLFFQVLRISYYHCVTIYTRLIIIVKKKHFLFDSFLFY